MAFGFFFNMEKLSLIIAENHINNMTNNNYEEDVFLDSKSLLINLEKWICCIEGNNFMHYEKSYAKNI